MKFSELIEGCSEDNSGYNGDDFDIRSLEYDSRKVKKGSVFFAIKGLRDDGSKYIAKALQSGAGAVICDASSEAGGINIVRAVNVRKTMADMSRIFYNDPSSRLKLIGVTGTNGKTTTVHMVKKILEHSGKKCGVIGTVNYSYGMVIGEASLTTPDSVELNMILNEMADSGMEYCAMEVSSIALVMERVHGLKYGTALFSNLTSEHLDFHGTMEEYFSSKKILFDNLSSSSNAISNADDNYGLKILDDTKAEKFFYSIEAKSGLMPENISISVGGISFDLRYRGASARFISNLTGRFNLYNILAATAVALKNGVELGAAAEAVSLFEAVRGRFNRIHLPNGATAVVDYSHTSDSLRNAIESARELVHLENKNGRVITIFGCGGNKDKTKRPVMGKFAVSMSDYAIITSDNPRYEDPYLIIDEIISGTTGYRNYEVIEDREQAIKKGIEMSGNGDLILICGKGHETYQEVKGVKSHFDDIEMVQKYSEAVTAK